MNYLIAALVIVLLTLAIVVNAIEMSCERNGKFIGRGYIILPNISINCSPRTEND